MIAGGNTIVFNVHPRAKKVSVFTIQLINRTIQEMSGPADVITAIHEPTVESAQYLMKHPDIELLVVTGGAEVVRIAMASGKNTICAGPGNPPVVVDETADIAQAAENIIRGSSFDNNLVCCTEKEVFVVSNVAEQLKAQMCMNDAFEVPHEDIDRLSNYIFTELGPPGKPGKINLKLVGQNASKILQDCGFSVPNSVRVAIVEVPSSHNLVWTEQMMPVLPIVRVNDVDEAIQMALKAEHNFKHTAVVHSFHLPTMSKMAKVMDTSIFVKNAPSFSGLGFRGEGHTSFTIGTRTGEGLTTCLNFTRERRCTLAEHFRIV
jgi:propionaldehyde dehydrogenase